MDAVAFDGSQSQSSRDAQSVAGLSLLTIMGAAAMSANSVSYGGKSLDPLSNVLGAIGAYGGMLLFLMAYDDMMD